MPSKTLQRLNEIDNYIRKTNTGRPNELAKKMRISERQVFRYVELLKKLGASVEFCGKRKTYYYNKEGNFCFRFTPPEHPNQPTED